MSRPSKFFHSSVNDQMRTPSPSGFSVGEEAAHTRAALVFMMAPEISPAVMYAGGVSTLVRPSRVRNRSKTEAEEKIKKPADGANKKSPPVRKAPARGRYVDEYARPAI